LFLSFFLLISFHVSLIIFVIVVIGCLFLFLLFKSNFYKTWLLYIPLIIIVSYFAYNSGYLNLSFQNYFSEGFFEAFTIYQQGAIGTCGVGQGCRIDRAQYLFEATEIKNIIDFLFIFLPINLFRYFLEPIPIIRDINLFDSYLFIENCLRIILVLFCFKNLVTITKDSRFIFLIIFISYIFLEGMWAVASINWGTSSRHHVVSYGLLAILAFFVPKKRNIIS